MISESFQAYGAQGVMQDARARVNSDRPYERKYDPNNIQLKLITQNKATPTRVVVNNVAGNQHNYTRLSFDKRTILSAFGVVGGIAGIVALVLYAV